MYLIAANRVSIFATSPEYPDIASNSRYTLYTPHISLLPPGPLLSLHDRSPHHCQTGRDAQARYWYLAFFWRDLRVPAPKLTWNQQRVVCRDYCPFKTDRYGIWILSSTCKCVQKVRDSGWAHVAMAETTCRHQLLNHRPSDPSKGVCVCA